MNVPAKSSKKALWIGLGLFILIVAVAIVLLRRDHAPPVVYRDAKVERANLDVTILSTGVVGPQNRIEIKPPIAGRVEQVLVREGQRVKKGQILAWMSSAERAALVDAARAQGPDELKKWEDLYRPTPILAPIAGSIILRNVESGQTFTNSESVFSMSDRLIVKGQVDETDIAKITVKQKATIVLDAYPAKSIPARVDKIAYDAKTVNNVTTYTVDVLPDETPPEMRSGMTSNVSFLAASKPDALVVASEALRYRDGKAYVLTRGTDARAPVEVFVEAGLSDGKRTEILSGLNEGDVVLLGEAKSLNATKGGSSNPFMPKVPPGTKRRN